MPRLQGDIAFIHIFLPFPTVLLNQDSEICQSARLARDPLSAFRSGLKSIYNTLVPHGFAQTVTKTMSFSSLVSDLAFRDNNSNDQPSRASRPSARSTTGSYARSYTSTAATSVSISGDISSQLHGGYSHPLSRSWQAERQLTKVLQPFATHYHTLANMHSQRSSTPSSYPTKPKKRPSFPPFPTNTAEASTNSSPTSTRSYEKACNP